jgi:uncharacterized membrane protein
MGQKAISLVGLALGLILAYILVSNFKGTTSIIGTTLKGAPPIISSLQGVGKNYPPPAR